MAVNVANVLVGQAVLYTGPVGTVNPVDSLVPGAEWLSPWTHVGATEEGVSIAVGTDTVDTRIEEKSAPVHRHLNISNIRLLAGLSEDVLETMVVAYGGGTITSVAAGVGQPGKKTLTLSDEFEYVAAGFEGMSPAGLFRRVVIPKVVSVADVTTAYRRAQNNRAYSIELYSLSERSEILIVDQTAVAA